MTGFNHAAVGGLLATVLPLPVALPAAFASHFLLDVLPHYGIPHDKRDKSMVWKAVGTLDFLASWIIIGGFTLLVWGRPDVFLCGLVATSPDFIWVARILKTRSYDLSKNASKFTRWHVGIQWLERPWGLYLEAPLAVALFLTLQLVVA